MAPPTRVASILIAVACLAALASSCAATPLDDYIQRPEPRFSYRDTGLRIGGGGAWDGYIFNVTTLQWLTDRDSSQSIWWHYVALIVPRSVDASCDLGLLYITGGNSDPTALPTSGDEEVIIVAAVAQRTRCLGAVLYQVPNTPISFPDDPTPGLQRSPDESIAYSWWRFMRDFESGAAPADAAERILYLPMVKSAVQVLNVVQAVAPSFGVTGVARFLTGGVSKRGWTAWLLAAADKRIVGVVPIVLDALGVRAFLHRQYRMYGAYTWAMQPYWSMNITAAIDTPAADALFAICDPLAYSQRLVMPKFVISSAGDEFQVF
jgi:PhoPQ-activated pathogenicity-related protein